MDYIELLETYHEEMLETLGESVACPSVLAPAVKTTAGDILPFGRGVHDALEHMLCKGVDMGFEICNCDNYGGHIEMKAEGTDETFGIVAHLDVVPEGSGWSSDPFRMVNKDGFVYGRGVSDDKGPAVACLYAMKAIKEAGIVPKKNIRLVLGLDEETGKIGMEHYIERIGRPDMGITPDADFPLVNGEMGILIFDLAQKLTRQATKEGLRLTKLEAGVAPNAVPATAKAVVTAEPAVYELIRERIVQYKLETGHEIKAKKQGTSYVIEAQGLAAHGAEPQLGKNAISIMMDFLGRLQFSNDELNEFIAFYNDFIGFDLHGERLGCELSDEASGKLILNVGMAQINDGIAQLTVNIRYPVSSNAEAVYAGIEEKLSEYKIGIVKNYHEGPVYMDTDNPMLRMLMDAYIEETGDSDSKPFVIGGGTYAKMFDKLLAFGAQFPGEENTMHQADEKLSLESFYKMARIYARAIYKICC
ncbi:MAG: dipeptidase PepV [Clostridiales bacterium]|nr:dipeptidase PepV [Candidatus Crickella caballi]